MLKCATSATNGVKTSSKILYANRHCRFHIRRVLVVLFLSRLTICLWLERVPFTAWLARWLEVAIAQSPNASLLVQQGIERYGIGDVQGAIASAILATCLFIFIFFPNLATPPYLPLILTEGLRHNDT